MAGPRLAVGSMDSPEPIDFELIVADKVWHSHTPTRSVPAFLLTQASHTHIPTVAAVAMLRDMTRFRPGRVCPAARARSISTMGARAGLSVVRWNASRQNVWNVPRSTRKCPPPKGAALTPALTPTMLPRIAGHGCREVGRADTKKEKPCPTTKAVG